MTTPERSDARYPGQWFVLKAAKQAQDSLR